MSRTIEQLRAACALKAVEAALDKDKKYCDAYRSAARSLPAHLMIQGLGQTLALLRGDKGPPKDLYYILQDWLVRPGGPYTSDTDVLKAITTKDQNYYIAAQAEAVKLAG